MNGITTRFLAAVVGLSTAAVAAAAGIDLPSAAALRRAESAFELCPGVVVDPTGGALYLMSPEGGIEKVSVASGEVLWSTTQGAKPLALYGDLLMAQSVPGGAAAGVLEIAFLDVLAGGERRGAVSTALPQGVQGVVDEQMGRSFVARATVLGGEPRITWEYTERYVAGAAPRPGEPLEQRQAAAYRLDVAAGRAVPMDAAEAPPAGPALPPSVRSWVDSAVGSSGVLRAGNLLAATRVHRDGGRRQRISLKRWHAASGVQLPEVDLFGRPFILQFPSSDQRHLLVAERARPGDFDEYQWSIFSLETGRRLGQLHHHRSHAWFFVAGETLVYVEPPHGRLVGDEWIDQPRKLRAILLGRASAIWERPLRDTTYRGPFPP